MDGAWTEEAYVSKNEIMGGCVERVLAHRPDPLPIHRITKKPTICSMKSFWRDYIQYISFHKDAISVWGVMGETNLVV